MYCTVYKITNKCNGMIYVGVHRTENINDGYMGSGVLLVEARKKYSIDCFEKEILFVFDNDKDMFDMEAKLVNEEFVQSKQTYNTMLGGPGGPKDSKATDYYRSGQHKKNMLEARKKATANIHIKRQLRIDAYMKDPTRCKNCNEPLPYEKKRNKFCNNSCAASFNNTGRVVTEEQKAKTRESLRIRRL